MPKFDIVIGNPPYKGDLHLQFLKLAIDSALERVIFIEPGTFLFYKKEWMPNFKKYQQIKNILRPHLQELVFVNANKNFGVEAFVPFVISVVDLQKTYEEVSVIDKLNHKEFTLADLEKINMFNDTEIYPTILEKVTTKENEDNFQNHVNKEVGPYYIKLPLITGHAYGSNSHSFITNDFYIFLHRPYNKVLTQLSEKEKRFYLSFETHEEAQNCLSFITSKIARFALTKYKINQHVDSGELQAVPWLDWKQEWNIIKLQKHFNLTNEEMKYIYKTIGNYYDKDV